MPIAGTATGNSRESGIYGILSGNNCIYIRMGTMGGDSSLDDTAWKHDYHD